MFDDMPSLVSVLLRLGHIVFGIIWLGHLYFFNLVNVPFQGDLDKELKPKVNPKLLLRAFWWFRWGAMYTFVFGLAAVLLQVLRTRGCSSMRTERRRQRPRGLDHVRHAAGHRSCGSTSGS